MEKIEGEIGTKLFGVKCPWSGEEVEVSVLSNEMKRRDEKFSTRFNFFTYTLLESVYQTGISVKQPMNRRRMMSKKKRMLEQ